MLRVLDQSEMFSTASPTLKVSGPLESTNGNLLVTYTVPEEQWAATEQRPGKGSVKGADRKQT